MFDEDYTAGVLKGIPLFCINRVYKNPARLRIFARQSYIFRFDNNFGASIIEFKDRQISNGKQYELAVLDYRINNDGELSYDTPITDDVLRGDAAEMNELLNKIEALDNSTP